MTMERYPNISKWLAVRFPAVKSSLYLTETKPNDQTPPMFPIIIITITTITTTNFLSTNKIA
jgi:hypothetical protein